MKNTYTPATAEQRYLTQSFRKVLNHLKERLEGVNQAIEVLESRYGAQIHAPESMMAAYCAGADMAANGPNQTNCDSAFFSSPALLKEWERGRDEAPSKNGGAVLQAQSTKVVKLAERLLGA